MITTTANTNIVQGAILITLCYFFLALFSACAKLASEVVSPFTILFFQNSICFLLNFSRAWREGIKTNHLHLHLLRDVCGFASYFLFVLSIKHIPLANAVILSRSAPLWIPFVIWFWFKKKVPSYLWGSLIAGLIGLIFIVKPATTIDVASFLALFSGIFLAVAMVAIRCLTHTEPCSRILFYYFLFGTLISFPGAVSEFPLACTTPVIFFLLATAIFFYLVQFLITKGFEKGKVSTLAPLAYTVVLFFAILDRIFWHKTVDIYSLFGIILIIIAGIASIYFEKKYTAPATGAVYNHTHSKTDSRTVSGLED
jgi:drug/metabolite transporter (DMT)-like permease